MALSVVTGAISDCCGYELDDLRVKVPYAARTVNWVGDRVYPLGGEMRYDFRGVYPAPDKPRPSRLLTTVAQPRVPGLKEQRVIHMVCVLHGVRGCAGIEESMSISNEEHGGEMNTRRIRDARATLAAGIVLLGISSWAMAGPIGSLDVGNGPTFSVGQIYENIVDSVGDTLTGYGKVDSINSIPIGRLCSDCELTYQFGGYTVTSLSATEVKFTSGWYRYYLGFGADNDFTTLNAGGSAGDLVEATNGTLFLSLTGHSIDAAGNTLVGTGVNINSTFPTGFASGLADVDSSSGGIANVFFDTNAILAAFGGGNADFQFGSSFSGLQPAYPGECPGGAACVRGSADSTGTAEGISATVPEPTTLALLALSLTGLAAARRRSV